MADHRMDAQRRKKARYTKKAYQRKRRRRLLLLAVVILAAVCAAAVFLKGREESPSSTEPPASRPQAETAPRETEPPRPQTGTTVIHVAAAGDLNVTDYVLENAAHENGYDFSQTFLDVAPIFSGADLALLNFEGNLSGGSYGYATGAAPLELPKALKAMGIDAVQTANSAAIRQGVSGLAATLEAFDHVGLMALGTFADSDDFDRTGGYEVVEVEGIRIALVAFTKGMDNLGLPAGSEDCVNLLYEDYSTDYKKVDTDRIERVLRNVREEQPDLTIAMVHWGSEYNEEISDSQKKICKQLQEGGVDVIVGTHPHLVQKVEYDPVKKTLVAWSLGDFFGDAVMAGTGYSIILDLEITRDNATGETFLSGWEYIPIFTLKPDQSAIGGHRVVRIREAMERYEAGFLGRVTEDAYGDMEYALGRIEKRVNPPKEPNK
ncbi:MAG: CapA family protein [Oscillospiraceae bacterium]|nr:CapA family protein [Oscillospiraceae bacterium]